MKPLKGFGYTLKSVDQRWTWNVVIPGRAEIYGADAYATEKSARIAAKRFMSRCNIVLEPSK